MTLARWIYITDGNASSDNHEFDRHVYIMSLTAVFMLEAY